MMRGLLHQRIPVSLDDRYQIMLGKGNGAAVELELITVERPNQCGENIGSSLATVVGKDPKGVVVHEYSEGGGVYS